MWGIISNVIGSLFGSASHGDKATDNVMEVAKGIGTFIDEQKFTEQERAEANAKVMDHVLEAVKATRDENSTRSVTRRYLAWSIMGTLLGSYWIALLRYLIFHTPADDILKMIDKFMIGELALAVGSFYFMASLIRARK